MERRRSASRGIRCLVAVVLWCAALGAGVRADEAAADRIVAAIQEARRAFVASRFYEADALLAKAADAARDAGLADLEGGTLELRLTVLERLNHWAVARDVATRLIGLENNAGRAAGAASAEANLGAFLAYL